MEPLSRHATDSLTRMSDVALLFRIDIGFDSQRGYAALVSDIQQERVKGIKGNSPEQLLSRIRHVLLEEFHKSRSFPLESEAASRNGGKIIMPDDS
jgi:hypothetical protein